MEKDSRTLCKTSPSCQQCAKTNTTCCVASQESAHFSFPLSPKEWQRIVPYEQMAMLDSKEEIKPGESLGQKAEKNTPEFITAVQDLFTSREENQIVELFKTSATHYRLRTKQNGACVFLGENGCALPRHARPWYCMLFPMWIKGGELVLFQMDDCIISSQAISPVHAMKLLGTNYQEVLRLYENLCADWGIRA